MSSEKRSIVLAALTGFGLLGLVAPVAFAHGPETGAGAGAIPGGNAPYTQQAPGQMMGGGMMGGQNFHRGMMGGQNAYGGMMGVNPPTTVPPCSSSGTSPSAPCGNQGFGGMNAPQKQMLPMTR